MSGDLPVLMSWFRYRISSTAWRWAGAVLDTIERERKQPGGKGSAPRCEKKGGEGGDQQPVPEAGGTRKRKKGGRVPELRKFLDTSKWISE